MLCSTKHSDVTAIKANVIEIKKSFSRLPNPQKPAKDWKTFYCHWNRSQSHTDTKPHTIFSLSPKTQAYQTHTSLHCWRHKSSWMFTLLIHWNAATSGQSRKQMTCSLMYLFYDTLTEVLETLQQRCASLKLCQRVVLSFYYCIFGVLLSLIHIWCCRRDVLCRSLCPSPCKKTKFIPTIWPLPGCSHVYVCTRVSKLDVSHYTS